MTKPPLRWTSAPALACALCLVTAIGSRAAAVEDGRLEAELLADAADGRLDEFDFFAAALIASGVRQPCELDGWVADYAFRRDEVVGWLIADFPPGQRRAALRTAMHAEFLGGEYRTRASDLRATLATGHHNCLTATAVHFALCASLGEPATIWSTPGHVSLQLPRDEAVSARELTPIELLGKFYYNRGVLALESGRFDEGTELLRTSLKLDPADAEARENLLAGFNNWAVAEWKAGRESRAVRLIRQGLSIDATYKPLVANQRLLDRAP